MQYDLFVPYTVELLRDYPDEGLKSGDRCFVQRMPNERLYLTRPEAHNVVFETNAQETVHFRRV